VGFFFYSTPVGGFFFIPLPSVGDISSYFFLFFPPLREKMRKLQTARSQFDRKEKKEVSKKEKKARSSGFLFLTLRQCSIKTLVGIFVFTLQK